MSTADENAVQMAAYAVESAHQFHRHTCTCGFESARSRGRTAHITRLTLGELLGHEWVQDVMKEFRA